MQATHFLFLTGMIKHVDAVGCHFPLLRLGRYKAIAALLQITHLRKYLILSANLYIVCSGESGNLELSLHIAMELALLSFLPVFRPSFVAGP